MVWDNCGLSGRGLNLKSLPGLTQVKRIWYKKVLEQAEYCMVCVVCCVLLFSLYHGSC